MKRHLPLAAALTTLALPFLSTHSLAQPPATGAPVEAQGAKAPATTEEQFTEGKALLKGDGRPKEPEKAFALIKSAAEQGHAEAMGILGFLYFSGTGVQKSEEESVAWFRKGSEGGSAYAQYNFGRMLATGRGVQKDENEGVKWIRAAADQGNADAQSYIGEILFAGSFNQQKDLSTALEYLRKAAAAEDGKAQALLGVAYRDGLGVDLDHKEAVKWFRLAAEKGIPLAQTHLGHSIGLLGSREQTVEALKWLFMAESAGEPMAKRTLKESLKSVDSDVVQEARKLATEARMKKHLLKR